MPEISLPKQLSGPEALDSMLFALRQKLAVHSRFQSHMAYAGYRAEIQVKFYPPPASFPKSNTRSISIPLPWEPSFPKPPLWARILSYLCGLPTRSAKRPTCPLPF